MLTAIRSQIFRPALALCAMALVAAASVPHAVAPGSHGTLVIVDR